MRKKLLTLEDLVLFCSENKLKNFSAEESGYQICVQVPSIYAKDEEQSNDSLLMGTVKLLHTNSNRNGSNVTKEAAEKCLSSIQYKPILANFVELEDGNMDFTSHDMEINEDGSINYIERQIGCFTSDKPYMEYDKETDRFYIYAKVAIPREYTSAAEIIERKGGTKISAELAVNSMSYDAKSKELILEDIEVMGATCLGTNPNTGEQVQEGMEGARLDIADFSAENNSVKFEQNDKLIELLESLNNKLDSFNISDNSEPKIKEGGNQTMFESLLEKYGKTVEDIEFEYDGLTDEELEIAFANAFDEADGVNDGDGAEPEAPASEEPEVDPETTEDEDDGEEPQEEKAEFSIVVNGETKTFSLSLNDKLNAMHTLINETYSDLDCDYYDINVFEEEGIVEMYGLFSGKAYRQNFKCKKKCNYQLVGDRCEIFSVWMTADEQNAFEKMKADFAELQPKFEEVSDKLAKYEAEPEKMEIINSEDYSQIANTDEVKAFSEKNAHFDMSVEDVKSQMDSYLLEFAKKGNLNFSSTENNKEVGRKTLPLEQKKQSRYGNLFSK